MNGEWFYNEKCYDDKRKHRLSKKDFQKAMQNSPESIPTVKKLFSDFSSDKKLPSRDEGYRGLMGFQYPAIDIEVNFYANSRGVPDIEFYICRKYVRKDIDDGEPFWDSDRNAEAYLGRDTAYGRWKGKRNCVPHNVDFSKNSWESQMQAEMKRILDIIIEQNGYDPERPEVLPDKETA